MSKELTQYSVVNEQSEERVVSRKIKAWLLLLSLLTTAVVLGFLIGAGLTNENDPFWPSWSIGTAISMAVIWFPFGRHWFMFYYKGILISGKRNRLIAPCFKHDCIWDKFRNNFWPKRHSVPLDEIERLFNSKKRKSRKTSDGKKHSWRVYELNITGNFGALTMEFKERNKRDETRNAIRSVLKSCSIRVSESTDAFN